jgi:hypothetical protein
MARQTFTAVTVLLLLLCVSGCGHSKNADRSDAAARQQPRLSEREFRRRANALCAKANDRMDTLGARLTQVQSSPNPNAIPRLLLTIRLANIVAEDAIRRLRAPEAIQASVKQALSFEEHGDVLTIRLAGAMSREQISDIRKFSKQVHAVDDKAANIELSLGLTNCAAEEPVTGTR